MLYWPYFGVSDVEVRFTGNINGKIVSNIEMDKGSLQEDQIVTGRGIKYGTRIVKIESVLEVMVGENAQKALNRYVTIELSSEPTNQISRICGLYAW